MKPAHLHLTLAMLKLYSEERRQQAREVSDSVSLTMVAGGEHTTTVNYY